MYNSRYILAGFSQCTNLWGANLRGANLWGADEPWKKKSMTDEPDLPEYDFDGHAYHTDGTRWPEYDAITYSGVHHD